MAGSLFDKVSSAIDAGIDNLSSGGTGVTDLNSNSNPTNEGDKKQEEATPVPVSNPIPVETAETNNNEEDFNFTDEQETVQDQNAKPEGINKTAEAKATGTPEQVTTPKVDEDQVDWSKMLPKEVEDTFLRTNRGRQMLTAFKERRDLAKLPSEGGLGFIPSADQIKEYFKRSTDYESMLTDFDTASPQIVRGWAEHWFAPDEQGKLTESQIVAAREVINVAQAHPVLYKQFAIPAVNNYVNELYDLGERSATPEDREYYTRLAVAIEGHITGKTPEVDFEAVKQGIKPQPKPDPLANERAQLRQREMAIEQQQQKAIQSRQQNIDRVIVEQRNNQIDSDISEALKQVPENIRNTSFFSSALKDFKQNVQKNIQLNETGLRRYLNLQEKARRSGKSEDIKEAADFWSKQLARPVIRQLRSPFIREASKIILQESEKRHTDLTQHSQSSGTTQAGTPVASSILPGSPTRQKDETMDEYMERMVRSRIAL